MRLKANLHIISAILLVWSHSKLQVASNPILFNPTSAPMVSLPSMPIPAPMLMGPQFDPFGPMAAQSQYLLAPPLGPLPYDLSPRSHPKSSRSSGSHKRPKDPVESDEQKALDDIPVSFLEPDGPSSITERISDSFSAIGEGFKNHFRSLTENFSDTMEDIRDAWRLSDGERKRGDRAE